MTKSKKERAVHRAVVIAVVVLGLTQGVAGCGDGDRPSCRGAIEDYYETGCYFIDLTTQEQIAADVMISYCHEVRAIEGDACQDALDHQLTCLRDARLTGSCDCMDEQAVVANACALQ